MDPLYPNFIPTYNRGDRLDVSIFTEDSVLLNEIKALTLPFAALLSLIRDTFISSFKAPSPHVPDFVRLARLCLQTNDLVLSSDGVGGTYFVQDCGTSVGVFKPVDEEPGANNNPKKLISQPLLPPGGGASREVAAFLLDRGFAGVPPTYLLENVPTKNRGIKTGSVQKFVPNDGESSLVGSSSFSIKDVHHIGILDIRLFNMDRNGENLLIRKEGSVHRLIPIDHTYILPESFGEAFFEWMFWNQAREPFDQESLDYIRSLNVDSDAAVLRGLGLSEKSIRTMVVSTILLKHCASVGKNLFFIASLMCRDCLSTSTRLEDLVALAQLLVDSGKSNFTEAFSCLIKEKVQ